MLEVIGKKFIHSKKNDRDYVQLHCTTEFDGIDNASGQAVEMLFLDIKHDVPLGTLIEPVYKRGFNGNAVLTELKVVS